MNDWKSLFVLGLCIVFAVGCGTKKPDGIPQLHPAKVTVTNGTSPIAEASVFLILQGGASGSWSTVGVTDAKGVAVINTSQGGWTSKGVPEGEYKIYITKAPDVKLDPPSEEIMNDSAAWERFAAEQAKIKRDAPKIIPEKLANPAQSPLTLTVTTSGTAELAVDISEHQ